MTSPISTAYVFINIAAGTAHEVLHKLDQISNIAQVDIVTGPYDIIALIQGSDFNQIGSVVMNKVQTIEGIVNSITCNVIRLET